MNQARRAVWQFARDMVSRPGWAFTGAHISGRWRGVCFEVSHFFDPRLPPGQGTLVAVSGPEPLRQHLGPLYRPDSTDPDRAIGRLPGTDPAAVLAEYDRLALLATGRPRTTPRLAGEAGLLAIVASLIAADGLWQLDSVTFVAQRQLEQGKRKGFLGANMALCADGRRLGGGAVLNVAPPFSARAAAAWPWLAAARTVLEPAGFRMQRAGSAREPDVVFLARVRGGVRAAWREVAALEEALAASV